MKRGLKIGLLVPVLVFIGLVIWRVPYVLEQERSAEVAEYISNVSLSMIDVDGNNLPPVPNEELNNTTIEGIDANENDIRDDVELAIFELYPDDRKLRAASLQYAMAMQVFIREVFSEETWKIASQQEGRAYGCILDTLPDFSIEEGQERATELHFMGEDRLDSVKKIFFNTQERRDYYTLLNQENATSLKSSDKEDCDLNI